MSNKNDFNLNGSSAAINCVRLAGLNMERDGLQRDFYCAFLVSCSCDVFAVDS